MPTALFSLDSSGSHHSRVNLLSRVSHSASWSLPRGSRFVYFMFRALSTHTQGVLTDSRLLGGVQRDIRAQFLANLAHQWLPGKLYSLLYRGSRDGLTAPAFHAHCDGRGPTLTFILSESAHVFGGHAGCAWSSSGGWLACDSAFLFSVTSPFAAATRFPLLPSGVPKAVGCSANAGPIYGFGQDLLISGGPAALGDASSQSRPFNSGKHSFSLLGSPSGSYADVVGKGDITFTGTRYFQVEDMEVYLVV